MGGGGPCVVAGAGAHSEGVRPDQGAPEMPSNRGQGPNWVLGAGGWSSCLQPMQATPTYSLTGSKCPD